MTSPFALPDREVREFSSLLQLISSGRAASRVDLTAATGLSASTITQRVGRLLDAGLVMDDGFSASRGGRKPSVLRMNPSAGVVLTAIIGATACRWAVVNLSGEELAEDSVERASDEGPGPVLELVVAGLQRLLAGLVPASPRVVAISVGVASAVDPASGRIVRPLMRLEWDGFRIADAFADPFPGVTVLTNNDADLMAVGEHWARQADSSSLVFVKVGTGIGCGIVDRGRLISGVTGGAGDIGHIRVPGHEDARCNCGKSGCLTAVASGRAIADRLRAMGLPAHTGRDVVRLVRSGDLEARHAVRAAALEIGNVVAMLVGFFNPDTVVIGGLFGHLAEDLLTDVRSAVYSDAQPLATGTLTIESSILGERAGLVGAGAHATRHLMSPSGVTRLLQT